jgi:hypothetical protein
MSARMRWPRRGSAVGWCTQYSRLGGMRAGSSGRVQLGGASFRNAWHLPLESKSASQDPVSEQRVILSTVSRHLMPAATTTMARTNVEHRSQVVLYPLRYMSMAPLLSTHTRTGLPRQASKPAAMHTRGPTSSNAESFLLNRRPSGPRIPELIVLPQGSMYQKFGPTPPEPLPIELVLPPAASV